MNDATDHPLAQVYLDPWQDAALLSARLQRPDSRLIVLLAAEAWCSKCRAWRPAFDTAAAQAEARETWLWLDIEDHAEFMGTYLPDDLPHLLVYEGAQLHINGPLPFDQASLTQPFDQLLSRLGTTTPQADFGLRTRLMQSDWASS